MPQVWSVNTLGGYLYSDELSTVLRTQVQPIVKFRQFCDAKDATQKGLHRGQIWHWDVVSNVATQGTTLVETSTLPSTNFTITQGSLSIVEYGNSVPYTGFLDDLSKMPVTAIINQALRNDAKKAFDIAAHAQFTATPLRVVAASGTSTSAVTLTTNGTATTTNNVNFGKEHLKAIVDIAKERNIPPYMNDDYVALAWPTTFRPMKTQLEPVHQYTTEGFGLILNGEIGRFEGTRFIEQSNVGKGLTNNGTQWTNLLSDWVYIFGGDTVAEAVAIPEEMRGMIPSDYGRSRGIAWYYLGGFGIIHTLAVNARIIKWDSAA